MSHFFRARLFSRLITCDANQKLENNRKSLASYQVCLAVLFTNKCNSTVSNIYSPHFPVHNRLLCCES